MTKRFGDLPPGAKFVCKVFPKRPMLKLNYPTGPDSTPPDCNCADLKTGLRCNLSDDELCEVRE